MNSNSSSQTAFPRHFYWGASTSSHQVEGNTHNDWSEWEKSNAERLAKHATTYWQPWQREKFPEMLNVENYISGRAVDHYTKYDADFKIAAELGHNAHRFSIEWSRVEPEEGKFNNVEIEHYKEVVMSLNSHGLEPFVTLYHWTQPLWFRNKKGWENAGSSELFARFAKRMVEALPGVNFWVTLNEPEIYSAHSYLNGHWPPNVRSLRRTINVNRNLARAHKQAYEEIKKIHVKAQVGIAKNNIDFRGLLSPIKRHVWNHWFLKRIATHQDFIGLNYYFSRGVSFGKSDMGWDIVPEGLTNVLLELKTYNRPIYITENGIADKYDQIRADFIRAHVRAFQEAMKVGVDVRGYLYWSLLDNFEWDKGFWPRFGLIEVDPHTLQRTVRPSAYAYKELIESFNMK